MFWFAHLYNGRSMRKSVTMADRTNGNMEENMIIEETGFRTDLPDTLRNNNVDIRFLDFLDMGPSLLYVEFIQFSQWIAAKCPENKPKSH